MSRPKNQQRGFSELSHQVIGCAIEVHRHLGPGLLEETYKQCLAQEMLSRSIEFQKEVALPVSYKGKRLDCGYRIDLLVENALVLELKSIDQLKGIHQAQLITYLKLSGLSEGLLINFNVMQLKDGLRRVSL